MSCHHCGRVHSCIVAALSMQKGAESLTFSAEHEHGDVGPPGVWRWQLQDGVVGMQKDPGQVLDVDELPAVHLLHHASYVLLVCKDEDKADGAELRDGQLGQAFQGILLCC